MPSTSTRSLSHRRLSRFVDWIATPDDREDRIRTQTEDIRSRIRARAEDDGLTIRSTPYAGSFAKRTGLRRHYNGQATVDGQDVDLPFVISPKTRDGQTLNELLGRFERYAIASYPSTTRERTNSAIRMEFAASKINYDLVPMLAVLGTDDEQVVLRGDGEKRRTSVQKHIEFIKSRTRRSNDHPGRVKFNECLRLIKWWREFRQDESQLLDGVPTIVLDLLAAHAFDQLGVDETYTVTLSRWFGWMANVVRRRVRVSFSDFGASPSNPPSAAIWAVLDPVNPDNNVIPTNWSAMHLDEFAEWFETARDQWGRLIAHEMAGDDAATLRVLVELFGNPFKHHGILDDVH